jgi:hypothetical protein
VTGPGWAAVQAGRAATVLEFIRRADASAYGYHFEPRDLAPSAPAPRSPICPCGIDRRDCEYHL